MWDSDNVIFNVNGVGLEKLKMTIKLAIGDSTIDGWKFKKDKGLCLYNYIPSSKNDINIFPISLNAEQIAMIVFDWLKGDEAKTVPCEGWDANAEHDGSNELGWRVYTENWGHVDDDASVLAVKPAYLWYGK